MADQSTQSIVIDAAPEQIMAVISDFAKYPEWAEAVKHTEVLSSDSAGRGEQVRFVIDAGPLKDEYVLDYDWADDGRSVSWNLVKGQMQKAQSGSYVLAPEGSSTKVTYSLSVELTIPMIGLFRRKAEKMIMDVALKELKTRAESAA
ncbi:SRPBCC family protein [Allokutzneria albata]|uniref:Ribosome association toxin PasT (RatA) of the RatAB toxin-antitoxin module n=1 Tax=Allokutzneria albata TaxID=211114 RepID=A0A1H0CRA4_ALLAB|nr:SRPBCC family protein [Allokutzneria albata]SDN60251.1 Ribosome association toxin PasT (RatA) of the RatAB toxin-antitoxin module [Allokutzneria albata]